MKVEFEKPQGKEIPLIHLEIGDIAKITNKHSAGDIVLCCSFYINNAKHKKVVGLNNNHIWGDNLTGYKCQKIKAKIVVMDNDED